MLVRARRTAVALCTFVLVFVTAPADVGAAAATRTISFQLPSSTTTGASVTVRGTLSRTAKGSPVVIQRKSGTRWVKVAATRTATSAGAYSATIRVPGVGGTYQYRADAPASRTARRVVSTARSIIVRVRVRASLTASSLAPAVDDAITLSGAVSPWAAGTPVVLQRRTGMITKWTTVATLRPDATGRYRHSLVPAAEATSQFRTVVAARGYRTSARSSTVSVTPVENGPRRVTGLRATSSTTQVVLSWVKPPNTTQIIVRRTEGSVPPGTVDAGTAIQVNSTRSGATDTSASPGQSYAYSVFATTDAGTSPASSIKRPGPALVTDVRTAKVPGKITFRWTNPAGAARVLVRASFGDGVPIGSQGPSPDSVDLGLGSSYTVSGLHSREVVGLSIYALDSAGNHRGSVYWQVQSVDGTDVPPAPISGPTAEADPRAVTLRWSHLEEVGADAAISRAEGLTAPASPSSGHIVGRASGTETIDDLVDPGRTYTYGFWAVDGWGNYSTRVTLTVTTPRDGPAPGPVTGLTATPLSPTGREGETGYDAQRVRLRWTSPLGADAIVVTRTKGPTAPASPRQTGAQNLLAPADSLVDYGLAADTEYSYAVWAVGANGSFSKVATTTVRSDANRSRPIRGRTIDSRSGESLGSVEVTFLSETNVYPTGRATYTTTSNPDGSYDIDLPIGPYGACIDGTKVSGGSPQGYVYSCSELFVGPAASTAEDLKIHPAVSIRGVVTDDSTGEPVAGVTVTAMRPYPYLWPSITTTTDHEGRYLLKGVSASISPTTLLSVGATTATSGAPQGYDHEPGIYLETATPGETVEQDVGIAPLRVITVTGRATSASGGAAVPGVGVHLVDERGVGDGTPLGFTDDDGRYSVETALGSDETIGVCFDAERHRTPAAATGFSNQCFGGADFDPEPPEDSQDRSAFGTTTPVSSSSTADVALVRASTVSGRVSAADGAPLAGVTVIVRKHQHEVRRVATTDPTGRYVVPIGVPATGGSLSVRVCPTMATATGGASTGGYQDPSCVERSLSSAEPISGADFVAQPAATVTGTVRDLVSDAPLAGMTVELEGENVHGYATTAADGSYAFRRFVPVDGEEYKVCARGADRAETCRRLAELGVPSLPVGSTTHAEPLRVAETGSVSGILTGADTGEPIADVMVELRGEFGSVDYATTDTRGRYSFDQLRPGRYGLEASANESGPRGYHRTATDGLVAEVAPGEDATAGLAMRSAAAVRVKVVTQDGRPAPGVLVQVRGGDLRLDVTTDAAGYATVRGLHPTDYPLFENVCAGRGHVGPGTLAGYTPGCGWLPTLTDGQTATTTVVVGFDSYFGALVRDASSGKPIGFATVSLTPVTGHAPDGRTSDRGFAFPGRGAVHPPVYGTSEMNPARPLIETARICVDAALYRPACFRSDSGDVASAPLLAGRPGMVTVVGFELTRE